MFKSKPKPDDIDWITAADDPRLADLAKKVKLYSSIKL